MERLERLPVPQTATRSDEGGAKSSVVNAAVAVFNTSELLEAILSHLPVKHLLVSGSVNKAFYKLTLTSPSLQKRLFLLPANSHPLRWKLVCDKIDSMHHAVVSNASDDVSTSLGPKLAFGEPAPVARLNPLLKLLEERLSTADRIRFVDSPIGSAHCCDSAILDTRIIESRMWPHVYLTDTQCTCAHIDIEYADQTPVDGPVLKVRREVYNPAGVTLGAIYDALHEKGSIVMHHRREYASCPCLTPDTTIREQLQILEQQGFRLLLTPDKATFEFLQPLHPGRCGIRGDKRNGRVKCFAPQSLW